MPIYAYRCSSCGHAKDVLQKMSDPVLSVCPACGASSFEKQLTAAGFQLKGSGWYVTDFRDGNKASSAKKDDAEAAPAADKPATPGTDKPAEKSAEKSVNQAPAAATSAPAAAPPAASSPGKPTPAAGA